MAFGDVIRSAAAPSDYPEGIGGQADKIWCCAQINDEVYELSIIDFSVVRVASSPSAGPMGMGGSNTKVWHCDVTTDKVYELDSSTLAEIRNAAAPNTNPFGMGGDSDTIWHCQDVYDLLYELSTTDFSVIRSHASIGPNPRGMGGTANTLWHCDQGSDKVYQLSVSDWSVIKQHSSPSAWPQGAGGDDNTFWHCDDHNNTLYELDSAAIVASTVTTDPATNLAALSATLNGTLDDDGGEACDCGFEWGETIAYGNTTPTQSRTTGQTFAQPITGLDPNKTYHFRAFATNAAGTSYGADRTFTTLVATPTVTTDAATGQGAIAATLNGTLDDDGGESCDCGFEWGLDTGYGVTTPTQGKTTGEGFSQVIRGLFPDTSYHFRAFATNSKGTGYGGDTTFTTAPVMSRAYALAREEL